MPVFGNVTSVQALPSQCIAKIPLPEDPTAQQSDVETQATLDKALSLSEFGLGASTTCQEIPFQCIKSVWKWLVLPFRSDPTAQQSESDAHATPVKEIE